MTSRSRRSSLALTEAGALLLELTPRTATLEDLFFELTEGADDAATPPAALTAAAPS